MLLGAEFSIYLSDPNGGLYDALPGSKPKKVNLIYVSYSSSNYKKVDLDVFMLDDISTWWGNLPEPKEDL